MKKRLFSFVTALIMVCSIVGLMPELDIKVEAKSITVYQQTDGRWGSHGYGYSNTACTQRATISSGGCGILAYVNAVYYMNGSFIQPVTLADWSVSHGHRVNGKGTAYSLYKSFADSCGSQYNMKFSGTTSSFSTLRAHLQKGGTAIYGAPGHIMCVVDYNASNGTYLLLDSYKSGKRGTYSTGGYRWLTQSEFTGDVAVNVGFHMIENINAVSSLLPGTINAGYATPCWITATHKFNTFDEYGNVESNRWVDANDNCYIEAVYTNGFVKIQYPASGTMRWSYAKLSDVQVPVKAVTDLGNDFVASITMKSSGKFVTASGENVVLCGNTDKNFAKNHYWHFIKNSNEYYNIYSYSNGKALDSYGATNNNGDNIGTYTPNGTNAQDWQILSGNGGYLLTPRCSNDGKVMDVTGALTADNTNIQLHERNNSAAQIFNINKVTDTTKPVISKVWFSHISKDMFRVEIDVADNVGLKEVQVPVWSNENGQDDLIWHNATQYTHGHWFCDIYMKDHKNNYGKYSVDIYARDFFKNADEWRGQNSKRQTASIGIFKLVCDANGGKLNGGAATYSPKATDPQFMYHYPNYCSITWLNPTRPGYTFTGWYTAKSGGTKIYGTDGKCVNEGAYFKDNHYQKWSNLTVYAQWKPNSYTVTFNGNEGNCSTANKKVTNGSKYGTLPTPTRTGYTFAGWFTAKTGGSKITADTYVAIAGNQTLYAQWKGNVYVRKLELDGGKCDKSSINVTIGQKVGNLPAPSKTGYTFAGWYTAKTGGSKVGPDWVVGYAGNGSLFARWTANTYKRNLDLDGGKCDMSSINVTFGQKVGELPKPTKPGYKFLGWYNTAENGLEITPENVVGGAFDGTFYAYWKAKGDFNKDDDISVRDAAMFQRYLTLQEELDDEVISEIDLNDDGKVNVFDVIILKRNLIK